MMSTGTPNSRRMWSANIRPLLASRIAAVATATMRVAPAPTAIAWKLRTASSVRAIDASLRLCVSSTSWTSRRGARDPQSTRKCPASSSSSTTTRPEFEPMSTTATGRRDEATTGMRPREPTTAV